MEVTIARQPEGSHSSGKALALRNKFRMAMELFQVLEHQVAHGNNTAAVAGSTKRSSKNARNQRKAPEGQHHVTLRVRVRTLDRE